MPSACNLWDILWFVADRIGCAGVALGQDDEVVLGLVHEKTVCRHLAVTAHRARFVEPVLRKLLLPDWRDAGDLCAKTLSQRSEPGRFNQPLFTLGNAGTCTSRPGRKSGCHNQVKRAISGQCSRTTLPFKSHWLLTQTKSSLTNSHHLRAGLDLWHVLDGSVNMGRNTHLSTKDRFEAELIAPRFQLQGWAHAGDKVPALAAGETVSAWAEHGGSGILQPKRRELAMTL